MDVCIEELTKVIVSIVMFKANVLTNVSRPDKILTRASFMKSWDFCENIQPEDKIGLGIDSKKRIDSSIPRRWELRVPSRSHQEESTPQSEPFSVQQSLSIWCLSNGRLHPTNTFKFTKNKRKENELVGYWYLQNLRMLWQPCVWEAPFASLILD